MFVFIKGIFEQPNVLSVVNNFNYSEMSFHTVAQLFKLVIDKLTISNKTMLQEIVQYKCYIETLNQKQRNLEILYDEKNKLQSEVLRLTHYEQIDTLLKHHIIDFIHKLYSFNKNDLQNRSSNDRQLVLYDNNKQNIDMNNLDYKTIEQAFIIFGQFLDGYLSIKGIIF